MQRKHLRSLLKLAAFSLVLALVLAGSSGLAAEDDIQRAMTAEEGLVAAGHPLAAEAGVRMLENGGNVVDAAVATGFALGVVEPHGSGMGGEGQMVLHLAEENKQIAIDFSGEAPSYVPDPEDWDTETEDPGEGEHWRRGNTASYVPGTPAGLAYALEHYGTMELAEVLEPAIEYAEEGFEVYDTLASEIESAMTYMNDGFAEVFYPDGEPLQTGDTLYQEDKANTLKAIADEGIEAFYEGEVAEKIEDYYSPENGGFFAEGDLASYEPVESEPSQGSYRDYQVFTSAPPKVGPLLITQLQIMDQFNISNFDVDDPLYMHLMMEIHNLGLEHYDWIIDPAYGDSPVELFTDSSFAQEMSFKVGEQKREDYVTDQLDNPIYYLDWDKVNEVRGEEVVDSSTLQTVEGNSDLEVSEKESTTHHVAIDSEGNAASVTQTVSWIFGAQVVVPGTGINMNNGIGLFSDDPFASTRIDPGKRPRSNLSPTILLDENDEVFMAIGTPAGGNISTSTAQTIAKIIDHEMEIEEAIEHRRFNRFGNMEDPSDEVVEFLEDRGHSINVIDYPDRSMGSIQAFYVEDGIIFGGADFRRTNAVDGF